MSDINTIISELQAAIATAQAVIAPLPVVIAAPGAATVLWDGATGVSGAMFNAGAGFPWENFGGDWTDANGVVQGPTAYAVLTASVPGPVSVDITALAKRWYVLNTGVFLQVTANACRFSSRLDTTPASRPVVVLTLDNGTTAICLCTGSATADISSSSAQGPSPTLTPQTTAHGCLQFALPILAQGRTIKTAILTLNVLYPYVPFAANVLELRPPKVFAGGTAVPGFAAKYPADMGIGADPAVRFETQFADATAWNTAAQFPGYVAPDAVVAPDATLGTSAINVHYHIGEFSPFTTDHHFSKGPIETQPTTDWPSELYFRYYLKLKTGYQCSVQGKKLPGIGGRYGWWDPASGGYYQAVDGNGGNPTLGIKAPYPTSPDGFYYSGWSLRHQAGPGPIDWTLNPYGAAVQLNTYAYHADMVGPYGDSWRWGNPIVGYVGFNPDRWYCVEQYVKMNTVVGPFDALGNGTGNKDGILRGWVDGVLVMERTDVMMRKHPAINVEEVWLDHYHGGTTPAEIEHPFAMANAVVANAYIGPMGH